MNYTEKYHLPQWEETDRILRTDFNQMCADMEAGLAKVDKPFVYGAYTGTGDEMDVTVGFRPIAVLIFCEQRGNDINDCVGRVTAVGPFATANGKVKLTDTGFHLAAHDDAHPYPVVNQFGPAYCYLAFRWLK